MSFCHALKWSTQLSKVKIFAIVFLSFYAVRTIVRNLSHIEPMKSRPYPCARPHPPHQMVQLHQLHHAQVAHLLKQISLNLGYCVHLKNNLSAGFSGLISYRANNLLNHRDKKRSHAKLLEPHAKKKQCAKGIS